MKVLNLYAGIGGNRKLWNNVEVTAIENVPKIAKIYQDFFLDDNVIITDAHQYLLDHYKEFDFIWSSPPCPTHSRFNLTFENKRYPSMKLYQEIILLKHFFKKPWVVENVVSYYKPLIKPYCHDGHYFWSNFIINENTISLNQFNNNIRNIEKMTIKDLAKERGYDLERLRNEFNYNEAELLLRNCVLPKTGLHVFNCAFKTKQQTLVTV